MSWGAENSLRASNMASNTIGQVYWRHLYITFVWVIQENKIFITYTVVLVVVVSIIECLTQNLGALSG